MPKTPYPKCLTCGGLGQVETFLIRTLLNASMSRARAAWFSVNRWPA